MLRALAVKNDFLSRRYDTLMSVWSERSMQTSRYKLAITGKGRDQYLHDGPLT